METYIAIDNVCAWPNLTLLADGTIAAVLFNQPNHSLVEGEVECWTSSDGGRLWHKQGVPVARKPGDNRMNQAAGLAHNGDLIVLCSGWTPALPPRKIQEPVVSRSHDGGRTWVEEGSVCKPKPGVHLIPFGDIVRGSGGLLGASFYAPPSEGGGQGCNYFLRSYDDGKTWGDPVRIGVKADGTPLPSNETALLCIDGQRLVAAGRTRKERNLELYASDHFGETWTHRGALTLGNQHPAHLLLLNDGRLLTYGMRNKGFYGIGARFSRDFGVSWEYPIHLIDFEIATDGGYPSSVQLDDGTIVTAYYSDKVPFHHRYHMGVARWRAEDD